MSIYTKSGDQGKTTLLFGGEISKSDIRCEAYGTIDQAVSVMGIAKSNTTDKEIKNIISQIQKDLFIVAAELATDKANYNKLKKNYDIVTEQMVIKIEKYIDSLLEKFTLPNDFILPGTSTISATIDFSRTIIRTSERRVVEIKESANLINPQILIFLNRISDLLFVLGRYHDRNQNFELATKWKFEQT